MYTGITRAKNYLILCGEPDVLVQGLQKTDDLTRFTSLKARLNSTDSKTDLKEIEEIDTTNKNVPLPTQQGKQQQLVVQETFEIDGEQLITPKLNMSNVNKIHPLIGMESISPYDFM